MSAGCTLGGVPVYSGKINYVPPYWDDLRVPVTATTVGGANDPQFGQLLNNGAGSQGVYTYKFSHLVEQELFFWCQIPHKWKIGTDLHPHVHWCPTTAGAGGVVWGLEYSAAQIGSVFAASSIITTTDSTSATALKHHMANFSPVTISGTGVSAMIGCRIFRQVSNPADTYGAPAALLEFDFHYQIDAPGSRSEYSK